MDLRLPPEVRIDRSGPHDSKTNCETKRSHAWQDRQEQLTLKMPRYVRNALFQIRGTILLKGDTTVSHSRAVSILPLALLMLIAGFTLPAIGQNKASSLEDGFRTPPSSAKPRVWWHWMNGNITKEGIKLDLEWMNRVGIGGFQNFDASLTTPKLVDKRLVYMTPEWKDAFRYATTLAAQLGLEEAIAGSPGWSESGGPWVKPNQGMKKIVWSETRVEGGKAFSGVLPHPPTTTGPFQNLPVFDFLAFFTGQPQPVEPTFYADTAVIAYK